MPSNHINPPGLSTPTGYTHVVTSTGGRTVYISGQVPVNAAGEVVGQGDLAAQARQVYENIRVALASAGATFADVVKQTTYIVNYNPDHRAAIGEVRRAAFGTENPPASTLVGVQALARPEFMIEVEVVAVVG
jgi:enamine deaminase RidA (YjgF/YER057c/UK114 family)